MFFENKLKKLSLLVYAEKSIKKTMFVRYKKPKNKRKLGRFSF